ncbi:hypothetical protein E2562_000311 [Oryza meyeriana var. granulata]|uniref:Uncharacterized protein n=1 Tax=Oryza meyeriana var. granulata TaxID=110450 RepID=A0A6G1CMT4_9ORYZ|nr:hypothetical protein E2562_000311 [Oryza meyeriana var. granulata]
MEAYASMAAIVVVNPSGDHEVHGPIWPAVGKHLDEGAAFVCQIWPDQVAQSSPTQEPVRRVGASPGHRRRRGRSPSRSCRQERHPLDLAATSSRDAPASCPRCARSRKTGRNREREGEVGYGGGIGMEIAGHMKQ